MEKLKQVIQKLANNKELEIKYRNHKLLDNKYYKDCFECHIEPDWLLIYQYINDNLFLLLVNIGSHSDIL